MIRFILWIILIYLLAKVLGVVLQAFRPFFGSRRQQPPPTREKKTKEQFDNVQDADFEDITDKK